jgi:hypothetical protein
MAAPTISILLATAHLLKLASINLLLHLAPVLRSLLLLATKKFLVKSYVDLRQHQLRLHQHLPHRLRLLRHLQHQLLR